MRCNFSHVARYSLKFPRCLLLVAKSLVTCCKICSLLVAEVARCEKSLVTRCKICSLQKSLVTRCKIRSLLVGEVARCKKSLVTCRKIRLLLVAEIAHCKKSIVTRCRSCTLQKITHHSLWKNSGTNIYLKPIKIGEFYLFFLFSWLKTEKDSVHNKVSIGKI